jgi:hypothetical protein
VRARADLVKARVAGHRQGDHVGAGRAAAQPVRTHHRARRPHRAGPGRACRPGGVHQPAPLRARARRDPAHRDLPDARGRYPTDDALAATAGISPSTRASGRARYVAFRRGCNHRLRQALVEFADGSRAASPWAQHVYLRARARGLNHAHAVRVLARAWLRIIWRCWADHTPYDPARREAALAARHPEGDTGPPATGRVVTSIGVAS